MLKKVIPHGQKGHDVKFDVKNMWNMKNFHYEIPLEPTKKSKNNGNIKWVLRVGIRKFYPDAVFSGS